MGKLWFPAFFLLSTMTGFSQKKFLNGFFDYADITTHVYFDDISDSIGTWKNLSAYKRGAASGIPDSLHPNDFRKHYYIKINGGGGLVIRLQKTLAKQAPGKWIHKKLEWRAGLGYRYYAMSSDGFSNQNLFTSDTTKTYLHQNAWFRLKEHYLDFQNTVVYKSPPVHKGRAFFFAGAGIQYSLTLQSRIQEKYTVSESKWNSAARRWMTDTLISYDDKYRIRNSGHFFLLIPAGIEFNFSDFFKTLLETTYFLHFRNKIWPEKKYSEGAYFSFTIRLKL
jgi:hypothetical protein